LLLAEAPAQDLLVRCGTLVVAPDAVLAPGELLLRDGKVAHVGDEIPADARSRAAVLAFPAATIVPGFVLAHAQLGQEADLLERAVALTPELLAAEAFDPFADDLAQLAPRAVTSCMLAPSSANVAGGIAALVKPGLAAGRVRVPQTYLQISMTAAARNPERQPTSLIGAVDMLRTALTAARTGVVGGPDAVVFGQALRGERPVVVHVESRAEILAALDLAQEFGIQPVLLGATEAGECLERVQAARCPVLLDPLRPELPTARLALPARLEQAAVPFAFRGAPADLRLAAALAVRHGTSRKTALAALTRVPAEMARLQEQVGSLRRGCDADFAVFSADPLDLTSSLQAVYVDGVLLHGQAPPAEAAATGIAAAKEAR
jgi:imidazolonepropionase-like amidohydrolase